MLNIYGTTLNQLHGILARVLDRISFLKIILNLTTSTAVMYFIYLPSFAFLV